MRIAIIVHGRFHAFDLAQAFSDKGHKVTLMTNYPVWAVRRCGLSGVQVESLWIHGVLVRVNLWLNRYLGFPYAEPVWNRWFGRWALSRLKGRPWDFVHCWSGVSEEILSSLKHSYLILLVRGSVHIRRQLSILEEEEKRVGQIISKPSRWIVDREEREYALADHIRVISSVARRTFLECGVSSEKVHLIPSAIPAAGFQLLPDVVEERRRRILSGQPLHVLFVGTLSFRKGLWDLVQIIEALSGSGRFQFRLVGPLTAEAARFLRGKIPAAELAGKKPQQELPQMYAWADIFLFPSLEEGYPRVLAQAVTCGVPVLATPNSGAADLLEEGKTGWILPARDPKTFVDRLIQLDRYRQELADAALAIAASPCKRSWADAVTDFENWVTRYGKETANLHQPGSS